MLQIKHNSLMCCFGMIQLCRCEYSNHPWMQTQTTNQTRFRFQINSRAIRLWCERDLTQLPVPKDLQRFLRASNKPWNEHKCSMFPNSLVFWIPLQTFLAKKWTKYSCVVCSDTFYFTWFSFGVFFVWKQTKAWGKATSLETHQLIQTRVN